jgi:hypothetical protein
LSDGGFETGVVMVMVACVLVVVVRDDVGRMVLV